MSFFELFVLAVGLSMDAFAVSVGKGLCAKNVRLRDMLCAGLWFGGFQALMPMLGYFLSFRFKGRIERYDHWIAFVLLLIIGLNMLREALHKSDNENEYSASFSFMTMLLLAVATSIDALAVGVTFGLLMNGGKRVVAASLFICLVTFSFSAAGVKIGSVFGSRYKAKAEALGGIILILIGVKILVEHLFF